MNHHRPTSESHTSPLTNQWELLITRDQPVMVRHHYKLTSQGQASPQTNQWGPCITTDQTLRTMHHYRPTNQGQGSPQTNQWMKNISIRHYSTGGMLDIPQYISISIIQNMIHQQINSFFAIIYQYILISQYTHGRSERPVAVYPQMKSEKFRNITKETRLWIN